MPRRLPVTRRLLVPLMIVPLLGACAKAETPAAPVPPTSAAAPSAPASLPSATPTAAASPTPVASPTASAGTASAAAPTATPSGRPAASTKPGQLIDYRKTVGETGVEVAQPGDVEKLAGATPEFKAFIAQQLAKSVQDTNDPSCKTVVGVSTLRTDGYAVGYAGGCGGAALAWVQQGGTWQQLWGGQELPPCGKFRDARFPAEVFAGLGSNQCSEGGQQVAYRP